MEVSSILLNVMLASTGGNVTTIQNVQKEQKQTFFFLNVFEYA